MMFRGKSWDDPERIKNPEELAEYIRKTGFLPLFANEAEGFSVEDRVWPKGWFSDDPDQDAWIWRQTLANSKEVFYGKFFEKKAGFISKEWFPVFANYRRDGYDFDARWDDGLAGYREMRVMDVMNGHDDELYSFDVKKMAGFGGEEGEKGFEGTITDLQMHGYLVTGAFRKRRRKKDGKEYGWSIAMYTLPERMIGQEKFNEAYKEDPQDSFRRIVDHLAAIYPDADRTVLEKIMK